MPSAVATNPEVWLQPRVTPYSAIVVQFTLSCRSWLQFVQRQVKFVGCARSCISDHNCRMAVSCSTHFSHALDSVMEFGAGDSIGVILPTLTQVIDSRSV